MKKINISSFKNILILTGAGISVASGIRPFRGADGLWNDPAVARLSDSSTWNEDPAAVWKFWMDARRVIQASQPNRAHIVLANLEKHLSTNQNFLLATQNIDGLHQKAGSNRMVELHGNNQRSRCSNGDCSFPPFEDENSSDALRYCPICGSLLRMDIVLFGENLPIDATWAVKKILRDCDLFIAIGTSGLVSPAADFVRGADYAGARTIYINLEPMNPPNHYFKEVILGHAEEILPDLFSY